MQEKKTEPESLVSAEFKHKHTHPQTQRCLPWLTVSSLKCDKVCRWRRRRVVGWEKHRTFTSETGVRGPCEPFPKPNHVNLFLNPTQVD